MHLRGQYALEQMGVIALALVIIAALFFFSMNAASDGARSSQAKDTAERIARAADSVYALGPGSKSTVSVNMPQGVQFVDTSNKRVWIRVALSSGNSDVFAATSGQIVGSIPSTAQLQDITLTVLSNGNISVGRQSLSCSPSSFTKTIVQGGSATDALTLSNSWSYQLSNFSSSISGVSDMVGAGAAPGSLSASSSANISLSFSVPGAKPVGAYTGSISVAGSNSTSCAASITIFVTSSAPADVTGPVVSGILATPSNLTTITPVTISATATDANNSVAICALQLDSSGVWNTMDAADGAFNSGTETIAYYLGYLSMGNHTVGIYCTDSLGNIGSQYSYSFSVSNSTAGSTDNQGPLVTNISVYASTLITTNVSVTAWEHTNGTATCPAGATISAWTSIYGTNCPNNNSTSCSSCTIGATSCTVLWEDAVCSDPCVGTVKTGQINLTCTYNSQAFSTSSTIFVNATASDATTGGTKIMYCQLQLDGGSPSYMAPQGGVYNAVTINVSSQLGTLAPGNHSVSAYCSDFLGNQGPATNSTFNIVIPPLCAYSRTDPTGTNSAAGVSWVAGYCTANSPVSTTISYNYTWYLNGVVNASGVFAPQTATTAITPGTPTAFAYDAGFTNPANANDSNYATYASYTAYSSASMYWNYTNPANSTNVTTWQTKHGMPATANDTLPLACASQPIVRLRIMANNSNSTAGALTNQLISAANSFAYDANLTNGTNANDSDYSTYAYHATNNTYYYAYWNYSTSLPPGLTGAAWQIKHGTLATYNNTLSAACLAQYPMQLRMQSYYLNSSYISYVTNNATILGAGSFAYDAGFTNPANAYDSNYATKASYTAFSSASMYWNYTNPANSTNQTTWQAKHGTAATANDTLPSTCAAQPTVQLRIVSNNSNSTTNATQSALGGTITTMIDGGVNYTVHTFTANGTFIVNGTINGVEADVIGGSGGGGGSGNSNSRGGGGGGGGAYSYINISALNNGSYAVTIGGAGAAGTTNGAGGAGGDSWFNATTTVIAHGGSGGGVGSSTSGGAGGPAASGVGTIKYSGGNGAAGSNNNYAGAGGGGAGTNGSGGNASTTNAGNGTASYGGTGGAGRLAASPGAGNAGNAYGGGGGGGYTTSGTRYAGGAGAAGIVVITYPTPLPITTNYSQSSQQCWNGTAWIGVGTASNATNNFNASDIYEQNLYFNTSNTTGTFNGVYQYSSSAACYNGTAWASVGSLSNGSAAQNNYIYEQNLFVNSSGNTTNYSQTSKFCWNGTAWASVGANSAAVNNFTAANIYEQNVYFNTTGFVNTPILNNTEYLVSNLTTTFANGQNWVFTCIGSDGTNVFTANSTTLTLTG